MRIEEGKYYRTRDGRKVGPAKKQFGDRFEFDGEHLFYHDPDGKYLGVDSSLDIVAEWTDGGPIVTETVRRIKPGVYGRLEVRESRLSSKVVIGVTSEADNIAPFVSAVSASELRELARVALEIAEYLDAQ